MPRSEEKFGAKTNAKLAIAALLLISTQVFAAAVENAKETTDQQAYCNYVTQQALAQRDLLLMPNANAGMTQPNTGQPMQLIWRVSASLSDIKKAGLTMDAARQNCELYTATTAAQQQIQYALPSLEKDALQHRLDLIQAASENLDALIAQTTKMMDAQNVTRPMLFSLQTTRIKLDADRADTQSKIAALYTPQLSDAPLKELIAAKQSEEVSQQKALDKLARQNDWDVALSFGAHQQVNPMVGGTGLYGAVTVRYNLGSHAINKHLDEAASAYDEWKTVQEGDVIRNTEVLRLQVVQGISVQESKLKSLQDEQKQIEDNQRQVNDVDTSAALDFRNQLASAQLLLGIEIADTGFRLDRLRDFLEKNY